MNRRMCPTCGQVLPGLRRPRSTGPRSQNSHVWGHAQQIAAEVGHEVGEVVEFAKLRATKRGYPIDIWQGGIIVPWSQTRIDTEQAGYLIEELHQIAAELDVTLQEK